MAHRGRQNADEALALALASGQSLRSASDLAGVGERTAARRWADPAFRLRVNELRGEMTGRALGRLADAMMAAADALRGLLDAEGEAVRLQAAKAILELGTRLRAHVELEERINELERQITGTTGAGEGSDGASGWRG